MVYNLLIFTILSCIFSSLFPSWEDPILIQHRNSFVPVHSGVTLPLESRLRPSSPFVPSYLTSSINLSTRNRHTHIYQKTKKKKKRCSHLLKNCSHLSLYLIFLRLLTQDSMRCQSPVPLFLNSRSLPLSLVDQFDP